ncbi:MAG: translocated intimin receptor Tir [Gammaproteobacteria bacterium]|nr:translocated intimin receptor Tir [Gammaproteobacteria bacterium]
MKTARIKAALTDPHLWIPLAVLAFGVALLVVLA